MIDSVGVTQHSVEIQAFQMHYRRIGNGPEFVVCLHGFPQTGRAWERLAPYLGARFTLIAPDLRGAGGSDRTAQGYDKKNMAKDIHDLLVALDIQHFHLVGHDFGAAVAYAYASQWPSQVSRLVLIEMMLPGFGLESMWTIRQPGEFAHMPFFMAKELPEWLIRDREREFFEWFIRNKTVNQCAFSDKDIDAYALGFKLPGALQAGLEGYRSLWQDAIDNQIFAAVRLPMPVLAIGGASSIGSALEQSLRPLTTHLQGVVFEECGHFVAEEQPERLVCELAAFFH